MSHSQVATRADRGPASLNGPDPEVVVKAQRRRFSAEYKRRILQEADRCTQRGEVGALLRREGLYSSHLNNWRHQRAHGELQGLTPAKWDNDACGELGFRRIDGQPTTYHFVNTIAGVRFDIAHHGPNLGKYPHTRTNAAIAYGRGIISTRLRNLGHYREQTRGRCEL